jgi:hypothetical protein
MFVRMLKRKAATGGELIAQPATRACPSSAVDGTYEKKPLKQRYHQFADGTRVGRDLYCAFLARCVHDGCLDAIQAAGAWTGTQRFLRAAADGFEPARGRGFALPHVTLGVRAGRSNNGAKCTREAGNAVALAHLAAARVPQSRAAGTEALALARGSFTDSRPHARPYGTAKAAAQNQLAMLSGVAAAQHGWHRTVPSTIKVNGLHRTAT